MYSPRHKNEFLPLLAKLYQTNTNLKRLWNIILFSLQINYQTNYNLYDSHVLFIHKT